MAVLNMISGPRNMSTAIMYSFAQHPDIAVFDEPFYGYYLETTDVDHPGREEIMKQIDANPADIFADIEGRSAQSDNLFLKNMGHHMRGIEPSEWIKFTNFFLIRDPKKLVTSLCKILPNPILRDTGMDVQFELYQYFKETNTPFFIANSDALLADPETYLSKVCVKLGLIFSEKMLSWSAGPKPYDGCWASWWYENVHKSTGFRKQISSSDPLPKRGYDTYEQCLAIYDEMINHTL